MKNWTVYDYFDHKSGSEVWPSNNPNDSPYDDFTCKLCGFTFSQQMYGSFMTGENPNYDAEFKMQEHIMNFHRQEILETA